MISEIEFVKRFCLHFLPKEFCKIRYFELYSSRSKISEMVYISESSIDMKSHIKTLIGGGGLGQ